MTLPSPVSELMLRWDELRTQGQEISAEELCRESPHLQEEVRQRIEALRAMYHAMRSAPAGAEVTQPHGPDRPGAADGWPAVPGYEILGALGRGGMGVVWKARHLGLNRAVALKMVLAGAHASREAVTRLRVEAESLARLRHPHVVQIYDIGEHAGQPYLSLEFVDGGPLSRRLDGRPRPPRQAALLVETLARAMHAAHQCQVVHRDLKPGNVLITSDGVPKVTDFGLAKLLDGGAGLTASGEILGTPRYMAPEQALGRVEQIGPATDVYSLGAILYELLTGRAPFQGRNHAETLEQVRSQEPARPGRQLPELPRDLEAVCLKCLEKDPAQRYASAEELADDLRRWQGGEPTRARPLGRPRRLGRWLRRNKTGAAVGVLAALLALTALVAAAFVKGTEDAEPPAEKRQRLEERLARGEAAALLGDTGLPGWYGWRAGKVPLLPLVRAEEPFMLESWSFSLLDLLRDPRREGWCFRAEVRINNLGSQGRAGIFFACVERPTPAGPKLCCFSLVIADSPRPQGWRLQLIAHRYREGEPGSYDWVYPFLNLDLPPATDPAGWRELAVRVLPEKVVVLCDRQPIEEVRREVLRHRLAILQQARPPLPAPVAGFEPRGSLGLLCRQASASFRRVVVEPGD